MDARAELETTMDAACREAVAGDGHDMDSIESRIDALETAVEEANNKALRTLADFQNYKKRALVDERLAREDGAASVLGGIITILDHFDLALNLDPEKTTAAAVIDGVRLIKDELIKAIADQGVGAIEPRVGDEFDPMKHQATGSLAVEGVKPGHISTVMQQGYTIGDRVLRPATVMIAPEAAPEAADEAADEETPESQVDLEA